MTQKTPIAVLLYPSVPGRSTGRCTAHRARRPSAQPRAEPAHPRLPKSAADRDVRVSGLRRPALRHPPRHDDEERRQRQPSHTAMPIPHASKTGPAASTTATKAMEPTRAGAVARRGVRIDRASTPTRAPPQSASAPSGRDSQQHHGKDPEERARNQQQRKDSSKAMLVARRIGVRRLAWSAR